MFEKPVPAQLPALPRATLSTAALGGLVGRLGRLDTEVDDAERITQLELLERLKGAAAAAQARVSVALDRSQRADQAAQGLPSGNGAVALPSRSPWPGTTRRPRARGTWASRRCSSTRCHTPWPR